MSFIDLLLLILSATFSLTFAIETRDVPTFLYDGDAPYSVDSQALSAALTCPNGNPTASSPAVLLVHGTASTGDETWGEGYIPALLANGYTACYVTIPGRAMGDMQVSAEYVAYNIHQVSSLAGGAPTSLISHSQGGPDTQWALQFWPSTHDVVDSFIALSPDFSGIELLNSNLSEACVGDLCQASIWQQSKGSDYYAALHYENFQAQVPTTAIWTEFDGVVNPPQENADLPSATALSVQQLCPGRLTNHITMIIDSAGFALALDALQHDGTASLARVAPKALGTCLQTTARHMDFSVAEALQAAWDTLVDGFLLGSPRVTAEPSIMPYAQL